MQTSAYFDFVGECREPNTYLARSYFHVLKETEIRVYLFAPE